MPLTLLCHLNRKNDPSIWWFVASPRKTEPWSCRRLDLVAKPSAPAVIHAGRQGAIDDQRLAAIARITDSDQLAKRFHQSLEVALEIHPAARHLVGLERDAYRRDAGVPSDRDGVEESDEGLHIVLNEGKICVLARRGNLHADEEAVGGRHAHALRADAVARAQARLEDEVEGDDFLADDDSMLAIGVGHLVTYFFR